MFGKRNVRYRRTSVTNRKKMKSTLRCWLIVQKKSDSIITVLVIQQRPSDSITGHWTNLLSATAAARFIRLRSAHITSVLDGGGKIEEKKIVETQLVFIKIISEHLEGWYCFGCSPNVIIIIIIFIFRNLKTRKKPREALVTRGDPPRRRTWIIVRRNDKAAIITSPIYQMR